MHISFLFHPTLFFPLLLNLEGVSTSSSSSFSASSHGKNEYLFQRQEQREAASGQKQPSLPPSSASLPLHRDLCCLDGSEWRSSCGWLRAKHAAAALPQQFKQWRAALLSPASAVCTAVWTNSINSHLQQTDTVASTRACKRVECVSVCGFWM